MELKQSIQDEIRRINLDREKQMLGKEAALSTSFLREREDDDDRDIRNPFTRDADRILHSRAYTRYMGKTQVFSLVKNDLVTTRAVHVQLVSKIAQTIGRALQLNEDLIEAIALGHDLGHTPYGHDGERFLNEITKRHEFFFKHNAQSVRLVRDILRLNLTVQTMDGILCHNGEFIQKEYRPDRSKRIEDFIGEYKECFERDESKKLVPMTMEGCVVRLSDAIAYVGRDIEDGIIMGILDRTEIPVEIRNILGDTNKSIVNNLIIDLLNNSYGEETLSFSEDCFEAFKKLKDFNYKRIYSNEQIKDKDVKMKNMFQVMFYTYLSQLEENVDSGISFFSKYRGESYKSENPNEMIVADYISGMTDDYLIEEFKNTTIPCEFGYSFKKA